MSRVLSSSRSGKKSDSLSGRLLPILKMVFIQQMPSSERKEVFEREESLTSSPSSSSVVSGSYFLFDILQLNCKTNDPETLLKYVRAFIPLSRKDFSFLIFRQSNSVSVTNESSVSSKLKKRSNDCCKVITKHK